MTISNQMRQQVRERARYLCEYCHTAEQWQYVPFTLDHILPKARGGEDSINNLALACFPCNRRKSDYLEAVDPYTQTSVPSSIQGDKIGKSILFGRPTAHDLKQFPLWVVPQLQP